MFFTELIIKTKIKLSGLEAHEGQSLMCTSQFSYLWALGCEGRSPGRSAER